MTDWIDLIQWPAMIASVIAAWWVAAQRAWRRKAGFWIFLFSNVLWVVWGWHTSAYALITLQVALAITNVRGIMKNDVEPAEQGAQRQAARDKPGPGLQPQGAGVDLAPRQSR